LRSVTCESFDGEYVSCSSSLMSVTFLLELDLGKMGVRGVTAASHWFCCSLLGDGVAVNVRLDARESTVLA
jgi:hypothetical protein